MVKCSLPENITLQIYIPNAGSHFNIYSSIVSFCYVYVNVDNLACVSFSRESCVSLLL